MADTSYQPKTYRKQGGDVFVIASGGELLIEAGGVVTGLSSYTIQPAVADITNNSGGTANGTIASLAAAVTLTDSTGLSGTHDDTLAATTIPADLTGGESPTEAEHNTLLAAIRIMAQNASDTAQKVIELVTWQAVAQDAVKELATKVNALLASLRTGGALEA